MDDGAIYRWIKGVGILEMGDEEKGGGMAGLARPVRVFGAGARGGVLDPEEGLVQCVDDRVVGERGRKREMVVLVGDGEAVPEKKRARVRFVEDAGEE